MKWYVLHHNFNSDKITMFNIFNSSRFSKGVENLLKKYSKDGNITFEEFKENLRLELMYSFWCKSEYEIMVTGLFIDVEKTNFEKIDIYSQVLPNLDILARYILEFNRKR